MNRGNAACSENWSPFAYSGSRPERQDEKQRRIEAAKAICATCPVLEGCLEWALNNPTAAGVNNAIWGGKTKSERTALRAERLAFRSVRADTPSEPSQVGAPPPEVITEIPILPTLARIGGRLVDGVVVTKPIL